MNTRVVPIPSEHSLPMLFALLLVACAAQQVMKVTLPRSGDVAMKEVDATDDQSYATDGREQWMPPQAFYENEAPTYPPDLLAANLPPVKVRVRIVVDEHGAVTGSAALDVPPDYPQFFSAVQAVVGGWKYWPLVKVLPSPGTRTEIVFHGFVSTYEGRATAMPFHQDYDFTFTQKDGRGSVTSDAPAPAR